MPALAWAYLRIRTNRTANQKGIFETKVDYGRYKFNAKSKTVEGELP